MTTVPTWAVYVVSIGTPVLTFVGVVIAQLITRRGSKELETRSKREETMRTLRWAAELAVAEDTNQARLGLAQLRALGDWTMLNEEEQLFIDAALAAVVKEPVQEIEHDEAEGIPPVVRVIRIRDSATPQVSPVPSEQAPTDEGGE